MAIYRIPSEDKFKMYDSHRESVTFPDEWSETTGLDRIDDPVWIQRYQYEAKIVKMICEENGYKKVLELGSGPGVLGQCVLDICSDIDYAYVDKYAARDAFEKRGYKGTFYVKDLMNEFDTSGLDTDYDLVIANDFLEHVANPSDILHKVRSVTNAKSSFLISVPNWRMGHWFINRGLFDYDNFIYFCKIHGFEPTNVFESPLKCPAYPRLSSEDSLPDNLLNSWNWYFETEKITD